MADRAPVMGKKQKDDLTDALRRWLAENRLPELRDKLLELMLLPPELHDHEELHEFLTSGTLPSEIDSGWLATCRYTNSDSSELFRRALDVLDSSTPFRNEAEFWLWLNAGFGEGLKSLVLEGNTLVPELMMDDQRALLAKRLATFIVEDLGSTNSFSFRVRFPVTTGTRFPTVGGGESQRLAVSCEKADAASNTWHVVATGRLDACTIFGARDAVCDLLREFVGAALAVGIAELDVDCPETRKAGAVSIEFPCSDPFCSKAHSVDITGGLNRALWGTRFVMPADASPTGRQRMAKEEPDRFLAGPVGALTDMVSGGDDRATQLRSAAKLLFRASTADEPGMAAAFAMMCLEAALLEPDQKQKESISARLSEAVAHRRGNSASEREDLRRSFTKLYDVRSKFVHRGDVPAELRALALSGKCVGLAREELGREIYKLPPAGVDRRPL